MRKSPRKTSTVALNEADRVLIRILATMDSIWLPMRDWKMRDRQTHLRRGNFSGWRV